MKLFYVRFNQRLSLSLSSSPFMCINFPSIILYSLKLIVGFGFKWSHSFDLFIYRKRLPFSLKKKIQFIDANQWAPFIVFSFPIFFLFESFSLIKWKHAIEMHPTIIAVVFKGKTVQLVLPFVYPFEIFT